MIKGINSAIASFNANTDQLNPQKQQKVQETAGTLAFAETAGSMAHAGTLNVIC